MIAEESTDTPLEAAAAAPEAVDPLTAQRLKLPDEPGVYRYLDAAGTVIYVGKAKSLRKRVNSYFTKNGSHDFKTRVLVGQIRQIAYTVVHNDMEALLLENNLIKQFMPKYNLMLKDGKSYPYICIKNERFPRVFSTRNKEDDGSQYFGPYPSGGTLGTILRFLKSTYKLRNCNFHLSEKNIAAGKFRPCLEYHIGNCKAPCVNNDLLEGYNNDIRQIRQLLGGQFKPLQDELKQSLKAAVEELRFEDAHFIKNRLEQIQKHRKRSLVVSEQIGDCEVLTLKTEDGLSVINYFKVSNGLIVKVHSFDIRPKNNETEVEMLQAALSYLLAEDPDFHIRILSNIDFINPPGGDDSTAYSEGLTDRAWVPSALYQLSIPQRGDEAKLLELSLKNCQVLLEEKLSTSIAHKKKQQHEAVIVQLQKDLRLTNKPMYIECFDNSHIQGYAYVSSMVVFRNGKPSRKEYRVYNLQTVEGNDDFAAMYEVVYRRYRRLTEDAEPLPDLIVIDGGKGQLSSAIQALTDLNILTKVPVVSIAKRLEEIYYMDDPVPLYIDKKSTSMRVLQHLRDEAHNTAISYHRKQRDKKTLKTELTDLPGVGPTTAKKLLSHFKSVKAVKAATEAELVTVLGKLRGVKTYALLHEGDAPK